MSSTSSFSHQQASFPDAELLPIGGSTCLCYRVRLYGKLHFLKRLKPQLRTNPHYTAALQKEFETGYALEHPYLVHYATKTEDGILMDYVDGETLDQFANSHPDYFRNHKNANRFLRQLLDVVGYLHQHQIVHLDLKPQNILITRIGHDVKLIDLGYCYTDTYNDTTGRTDKYAAPEQLNESAKVDARTDIYAIGRILQTLPCAHYYKKVIQRCTAKEMESRYASADEILQSMHSRWPWWTAALAVMFIAALAIYYVLHLSSDVTETTATYPQESTQHSQSDSLTSRESPTAIPEVATSSPEIKNPQIKTEQSTQTADAPSEVPTEPSATTQTEDTLALRRELQSIAQPIFDRMLATYRDSSYNSASKRVDELFTDFREAIMERYHPLWWERYRQKNTISERTFYRECAETWLYYVYNLFYQMLRNDGNTEYNGKQYHYYDSQKKNYWQ